METNLHGSITFHEDFRQPFATWALATMIDGEKRYAVVTCMPMRKPADYDYVEERPPSPECTRWDDAVNVAKVGLTTLLMGDTPDAATRLTSKRYNKWRLLNEASTPREVRWEEVLLLVERLKKVGGASA